MKISKRAVLVSIQPWDDAVNKAMQEVNKIDPALLKNVHRIVVHPGGGSGELGHVEMGGGKDPQEIHIYKNRIREIVMRNANATTKRILTPQELEKAIIDGITETLAHEASHIGKTRTPEQIAKGPFFGESEAERGAGELMKQKQMRSAGLILSKRANIQMACPNCLEDVSHLKPEKNEIGLYKMMTCPSCKSGFYPQDAMVAVKNRLREKLDIGNWPEKGWWMILGGDWVLGFSDSEAKSNMIKNKIINMFVEDGLNGIRSITELYNFIKYKSIGITGNIIAKYFDGVESTEIYGPYEENKELVEYEKKYSEGYKEVENDFESIMNGKGEFQKKLRKGFIENILNVVKTPKNYVPSKNSVISGAIPNDQESLNAFDEVIDPEGDDGNLDEARKQNARQSVKQTNEFVKRITEPAIKRLELKQKGFDPSKLCDDNMISKKKVDEIILDASLELENIREKFLPHSISAEPNLEFITYSQNKNPNFIKTGINLIKNNNNSIFNELNSIAKYNKNILSNNFKYFNIISSLIDKFDNHKLIFAIANFQYKNNLPITGKLDNPTIEKFSTHFNKQLLTVNFAEVLPGLYRGGIPDLVNLKELKNLGVKRIVSLHSNPEIPRMCNELELEYIPAFLETGNKSDLGRKIFGNSVSKFLLEKPTYIHCFYGADRTSGVIGRLRAEMGWPLKLVYNEMKHFGFKNMFADLLDWVQELYDEKLIDTNNIRNIMKEKSPYQNPEIMEQDCWVPQAAPDDVPFNSADHGPSSGYAYYINSPQPTGLLSLPLAIKSSLNENSEDEYSEDNQEDDDTDVAAFINGIAENGTVQNWNQGWAMEPFYDTYTDLNDY